MIKLHFGWILLLAIQFTAGIALARKDSKVYSVYNSHSIGFGGSLVTVNQSDLNGHIEYIGSPTSTFGQAYEYDVFYDYRIFDSLWAIQLRPSYFSQTVSGSGYEYSLKSYSIFPVLRRYLLGNRDNRLYMLLGGTFTTLRGEVQQPTGKVSFEGSNYGALVGLGAEFCFGSHCFILEGNYRNLSFENNKVTSSTGSLTGFTQYGERKELEFAGNNIETTMTGFMLRLGYQLLLGW